MEAFPTDGSFLSSPVRLARIRPKSESSGLPQLGPLAVYPPNPHCFQVLQVLAPTPGALCCAPVLSPSLSNCHTSRTIQEHYWDTGKRKKNACYRPANQQERKAMNSFQSPAMNSVKSPTQLTSSQEC